jgi:hypothetical protein
MSNPRAPDGASISSHIAGTTLWISINHMSVAGSVSTHTATGGSSPVGASTPAAVAGTPDGGTSPTAVVSAPGAGVTDPRGTAKPIGSTPGGRRRPPDGPGGPGGGGGGGPGGSGGAVGSNSLWTFPL